MAGFGYSFPTDEVEMNEEELEADIDAKVKEWHERFQVDWRFLSLLLREQADFCCMKQDAVNYIKGDRRIT